MKRFAWIFSVLLLITTVSVRANPVRKTIWVDGFERAYLVYTPSHPSSENASGMLVCLHGFGISMYDFFIENNISSVADSLNLFIVVPQALPEQNPLVNIKAAVLNSITNNQITLNSVWGCGLRIHITDLLLEMVLFNEELNKEVDDVHFIDRMIDEVLADYSLPPQNIFMLGTSMGGFMTYQYALRKGERLSGIISIAGSMGLEIKGMDYTTKIPVCDFHSVTDEIVSYTGSMEQYLTHITLAKPKTDVINYWRETNSTGNPVTEQIRHYPSTNGITVEKITYPHAENEVIHYKINGSPHIYFFKKDNGDCMDYVEEITRFIFSHLSGSVRNTPVAANRAPSFYPNPADDIIYITTPDSYITIYEITGKALITQSRPSSHVDLSRLKPGLYIIRIQTGNTHHVDKLIKR